MKCGMGAALFRLHRSVSCLRSFRHTREAARDRRRAPRAAVFGGNGRVIFWERYGAGRNMAPQIKTFRRTLPMHKYVGVFPFGLFSMIAAMLTANPSAKAESYTLPGESSKPSAEEFIGTRGLVGIYYGHLPRDGHPRQQVTLV